MLSSILLAISLSVDSLGIGVTYGLRDTIINKSAKIILFIISLTITTMAIWFGNIIAKIFSTQFTSIFGCTTLILMGLWIIFQSISNKKNSKERKKLTKTEQIIHKWFIKPLGITIQIIRDPITSDLDNSKQIDSKEAIYLGLALSLDALCVGIGLSAIGLASFLFPVIVAIFQLIFLTIGSKLGKKLVSLFNISNNIFTMVSGFLLIIIAIVRII